MNRAGGRSLFSRHVWPRHCRFLKFGTVGAFGVLVNLAVLAFGKEFLFVAIPSPRLSLNLSLASAILVSTMSNFTGNRHWTWLDRRHQHLDKSLLLHFGQYALACWVGIGLQFLFTNILAIFVHYLLANLGAIALAGIINYLVNDLWTFGRRNKKAQDPDAAAR